MDAPEIDGFRYIKLLGRGGFSTVYLYQQALPDRLVAIKVLSSESLSDQLRRQFTAEANLMARVSTHPSIGTVYAAGVDADGQPYLVMEYCPGGSLGARFRHEPLSSEVVLDIGIRMAAALETAHRAGIVHRDVKPANILVNDYGAALLTDFGISAILDEFPEATRMREKAYATSTPVEMTPESLGMSIPWSAPETFDDSPRVDERSDIFSLAATLFTLLAGRSPFERPEGGNRGAQLMARIQAGSVTPLSPDAAPEPLRDALMIGLAHDSAERFQSALAFATRLQQIQQELGLAVTPIETTRDEDAAASTATRRRADLPDPDPSAVPAQTASQNSSAAPTSNPADAAQPRSRLSRRTAALITTGVVAAVALVAAIGIPLALNAAEQPVAQETVAPASPAADSSEPPGSDSTGGAIPPFIDALGVTVDGDDVTLEFPGAQPPPDDFDGKVVSKGDSDQAIDADSTITFSYVVVNWYSDETQTVTFPAETSTVTTADLEVGIGTEIMGLPVGSVVTSVGPAGMFLFVGPFDRAEFSTQVVVVRIDAVS